MNYLFGRNFGQNWTEIHKNLQCVVVLLGAGLWAWHASAVGGAKRLLLMSIVVDVLRSCFTDLTAKKYKCFGQNILLF